MVTFPQLEKMFFTLAFLSSCLCCSFSLGFLFINKSKKLRLLCKNRIITSLLKIVNVMIFSRCCTCVYVICGWHSLKALHTLKSLYWWIQFYLQVTQSSTSPFFSFKRSTLISVSSPAWKHTLCALSLHAFFLIPSYIIFFLFDAYICKSHTLHLQYGALSCICFPYWWETEGEMGGDHSHMPIQLIDVAWYAWRRLSHRVINWHVAASQGWSALVKRPACNKM